MMKVRSAAKVTSVHLVMRGYDVRAIRPIPSGPKCLYRDRKPIKGPSVEVSVTGKNDGGRLLSMSTASARRHSPTSC
jgi:hypothetical protein